jgi:hypothetical protein
MRTALVCIVLVTGCVGCVSAVPYPTEREAATARRTDPSVTVASLARGRERYVTKCSGCHSLYSPRDKTTDEWPQVLDEMLVKSKSDGDDRRAIEQYVLAVAGTPEPNR